MIVFGKCLVYTVTLDEDKVCFNVGHFNLEELGMKYAAEWIKDLVGPEEKEVSISSLRVSCSYTCAFLFTTYKTCVVSNVMCYNSHHYFFIN